MGGHDGCMDAGGEKHAGEGELALGKRAEGLEKRGLNSRHFGATGTDLGLVRDPNGSGWILKPTWNATIKYNGAGTNSYDFDPWRTRGYLL